MKIEEIAAEHSLLSLSLLEHRHNIYRDINKNVDRIRQRRRDSGEADARERRARDHGKCCVYMVKSFFCSFSRKEGSPSEFSLVLSLVFFFLLFSRDKRWKEREEERRQRTRRVFLTLGILFSSSSSSERVFGGCGPV